MNTIINTKIHNNANKEEHDVDVDDENYGCYEEDKYDEEQDQNKDNKDETEFQLICINDRRLSYIMNPLFYCDRNDVEDKFDLIYS